MPPGHSAVSTAMGDELSQEVFDRRLPHLVHVREASAGSWDRDGVGTVAPGRRRGGSAGFPSLATDSLSASDLRGPYDVGNHVV